MKKKDSIEKIVIAAMLCAIGILIPSFFPKIVIGPASFTLASHVAVFLAMFISPLVAIAVALGTTLGFLFSGLPLVITLRAFSHLIYVSLGAFYIARKRDTLASPKSAFMYGLVFSLIHAASEVIVVSIFYFTGNLTDANYQAGFVESVLLLVGLGGVIHSMIDYYISILVWKPISKVMRTPVSAVMHKQ